MNVVHAVVGTLVMLTSLATGLWGAWAWRAGIVPAGFWTLLRTSQAVLAVQVVLGGVLLIMGREPAHLHVLYGLLPIAVSFVAEQLRLASADQVLAKRDMDSAQEMRALPETEQQAIVHEIVEREMAVMAASAFVVFLCALRASGVAGLL